MSIYIKIKGEETRFSFDSIPALVAEIKSWACYPDSSVYTHDWKFLFNLDELIDDLIVAMQ